MTSFIGSLEFLLFHLIGYTKRCPPNHVRRFYIQISLFIPSDHTRQHGHCFSTNMHMYNHVNCSIGWQHLNVILKTFTEHYWYNIVDCPMRHRMVMYACNCVTTSERSYKYLSEINQSWLLNTIRHNWKTSNFPHIHVKRAC
jgi:hypothetical protein